ncbi:MAG: rhodanese-like domain-containing protein [Phycisphaerales bacterium]
MNCIIFQRVLAIVGLGVIIGAADSWIRPTTVSLKLAEPAAAGTPVTSPEAPVTTEKPSPYGYADTETAPKSDAPLGLMIDSVAAKKLFDSGVVFLDARIDEEFNAGHVPQAFHLNSSLFNTLGASETMKALDPAQPIVIYCGGGDCDASKNLAILLQGAGYTKLHIIEQGFPEWHAKGFPVEKGAK